MTIAGARDARAPLPAQRIYSKSRAPAPADIRQVTIEEA